MATCNGCIHPHYTHTLQYAYMYSSPLARKRLNLCSARQCSRANEELWRKEPSLYTPVLIYWLSAPPYCHRSSLGLVKRNQVWPTGGWLVGALSSVNHKGLHQGWKQTSLYLQVIHFTSHHTTRHIFLTYLYSVGTQPGICENMPTASDIFYSAGLHRNHVFATGKLRRRFGKNAGECTGRV